jgi:hypothetical protein
MSGIYSGVQASVRFKDGPRKNGKASGILGELQNNYILMR